MRSILIRLLLTLPVVWLVVSLVFLLIHLVPGEPILQMLGEGATPADIGALRHQYVSISRCGTSTCVTGTALCTATWAIPSGCTTASLTS